MWYEDETFINEPPAWQIKMNGDIIFVSDVIGTQFLVSEIYTGHANKLMTSPTLIISQWGLLVPVWGILWCKQKVKNILSAGIFGVENNSIHNEQCNKKLSHFGNKLDKIY